MKLLICCIAAVLFSTFTVKAQNKTSDKNETTSKIEVLDNGRDGAKASGTTKAVEVQDSAVLNQGRTTNAKSEPTSKLVPVETNNAKTNKIENNGREEKEKTQSVKKPVTAETNVIVVKKDN